MRVDGQDTAPHGLRLDCRRVHRRGQQQLSAHSNAAAPRTFQIAQGGELSPDVLKQLVAVESGARVRCAAVRPCRVVLRKPRCGWWPCSRRSSFGHDETISVPAQRGRERCSRLAVRDRPRIECLESGHESETIAPWELRHAGCGGQRQPRARCRALARCAGLMRRRRPRSGARALGAAPRRERSPCAPAHIRRGLRPGLRPAS